MKQLVVIDHRIHYWDGMTELLSEKEIALRVFSSFGEAQSSMLSRPPELVVLDSDFDSTFDTVLQIRDEFPRVFVIVLTDNGNAEDAERAIRNGAWEYTGRPALAAELIPLLSGVAVRTNTLPSIGSSGTIDDGSFEGIAGNSPEMKDCLRVAMRAAGSDANVLIKGETGTGKELMAWAIHKNSPRKDKNFVVVDCAGLPENLVESTLFGHERGAFTGADRTHVGLVKQADGGTLFLDEIGELPVSIQKSFLRIIQERSFRPVGGKEEIKSDFRLISATNRDRDLCVQNREFRDDLLFRIRSFTIEIPSLRDRPEDIKDIVNYHLPKICDRLEIGMKRISPDFSLALLKYDWPGNIRELVSALERSVVAAKFESLILPQHLPTYLRIKLARLSYPKSVPSEKAGGFPKTGSEVPTLQSFRRSKLMEAEREYLEGLLRKTKGDVNTACKISRISRSRFYSLLKKHNISLRANFES